MEGLPWSGVDDGFGHVFLKVLHELCVQRGSGVQGPRSVPQLPGLLCQSLLVSQPSPGRDGLAGMVQRAAETIGDGTPSSAQV